MKYNKINNKKDCNYYKLIFDEIDMDHNEVINSNDIYNYLIKYDCRNVSIKDVSLVMNYYTEKNNMKINDFILLITDSRFMVINNIILKLLEMSEKDSKESYEIIKKKIRINESFSDFISNKNGILSKYFNISNVIGNAIPFIFNNIDDLILYLYLYIYIQYILYSFKTNYDLFFSTLNEDINSIYTDISTVITSFTPDNDYKSGWKKLVEEYKSIFNIDMETIPFIRIYIYYLYIIYYLYSNKSLYHCNN